MGSNASIIEQPIDQPIEEPIEQTQTTFDKPIYSSCGQFIMKTEDNETSIYLIDINNEEIFVTKVDLIKLGLKENNNDQHETEYTLDDISINSDSSNQSESYDFPPSWDDPYLVDKILERLMCVCDTNLIVLQYAKSNELKEKTRDKIVLDCYEKINYLYYVDHYKTKYRKTPKQNNLLMYFIIFFMFVKFCEIFV